MDFIRLFLFSSMFSLTGVLNNLGATVLLVPEAYETIQAAIEFSSDEDTVLIAPGIYHERINFNGKSIVVGSHLLTTGNDDFIRQTILDGDSLGTVVTIPPGSDRRTVLSGITIQNGGQVSNGGGIFCAGSSPILEYLLIQHCVARYGAGIYVDSSDVLVRNTTVYSNTAASYGAGIYADSGSFSGINFLSNQGNA
ncbi:MAG: hypothetical protein HN757_17805, partial [Calditrichaeota bacterium]|nr:hypothetical protein [Calditrichota bacterium]